MNREETLALYEQGVEAWNKWANRMLEERKRLEEAGEWEVLENDYDFLVPNNESTNNWHEKAKADFSNIEHPYNFEKDAIFSHYIFPGEVEFSSSTFNGKTSFEFAIFNRTVVFDDSIFNKEASFDSASFQGRTWFHSSTFNQTARFKKSIFNEAVMFSITKFNGTTSFDKTEFNKNAFFVSALFKKYTTFENTKFRDETMFEAIRSENGFSLQGALFRLNAPDFIQANFKEAPRLDNIEFGVDVPPGSFKNSITTYIHPDIKAHYQALKRLAIQAHDHENEQRFWAGELRSDRSLRTEDGGWNLRPLVSAFWWGNIAYGCFSDYGRSIVRPLGTLLVLVILMTGLHLSQSKGPLSYENTFSAGYISASKSMFNLGADPTKRSILKEKYSALYGANENQTPKIPKSILIAEMAQTLLSAILIFLALLGIRNNFKLK